MTRHNPVSDPFVVSAISQFPNAAEAILENNRWAKEPVWADYYKQDIFHGLHGTIVAPKVLSKKPKPQF